MDSFPAIADHILALLYGLLIPFLSGIRSARMFREQALYFDTLTKRRFYLGNSLFLFATAFSVLLIWELYQRPFAVLGFQWPDELQLSLSLYLTLLFGGCYLMDLLQGIGDAAQKAAQRQETDLQTPFMPTLVEEMPAYTIMCVSAGVFEEIVYRGFLVRYTASLTQQWPAAALWAVLLPALFFSIAHYYQGIKAVFKILVLSLLFGMIFWYSGSLLLVILLHFAVDFISGWISIWASRMQHPDES